MKWCEQRKLILAYVGNLGLVHDWDTLAQAVTHVAPRLVAAQAGVVVAASGPGVAALRKAWKEISEDVVRFESPLSDAEWVALLARTDISLATLRAEAAHASIPSKAFSAMAAGHALAVVAPRGSDLADLVEEHGCGVVVDPGDVDGFVSALITLFEDAVTRRAKQNASKAAALYYDMPALAEKWRVFLDELDRSD
jgi:colanic acid biosynthesis glycosyl transferase WcaI